MNTWSRSQNMRTIRIAVALVCLPLSAWAGVERIRGPHAAQIPVVSPHAVRTPPVRIEAYEAGVPVSLDPDVQALHVLGITGKGFGIAVIDQFLQDATMTPQRFTASLPR